MLISAVATVAPRVVSVTAVDPRKQQAAVGTGFCVDGRHVLTHSPLYTPGDSLSVMFHDGQRFEAEVAAADALYYLALLRLRGEVSLPPPDLVPPADLRPGLVVAALGNQFGMECGVTLGVVSAPDRTIYRPERFPVDGLVLTDAAIHLGNIGGPLITLEGALAGINGIPYGNGLNLCVNASVVMRLVAQMLRYGRATHPWLGFSGQTEVVPPAMALLLELPVRRGIAVADVAPGGPGERAGVRPFDMVVRLDDKPVDTLGAVRQGLAGYRPGESAVLTVLRGSELRALEMPVEEMPRLAASPWTDA
jgi:serine protease Do